MDEIMVKIPWHYVTGREWNEMADYVLPPGMVARGFRFAYRWQRLMDLHKMEHAND